MDAQILTFPAARRGLKAITLYEESKPIGEWELERLTGRIEWAASAFEHDEQLATKHLTNKLRVAFSLRRIEDLPRNKLAEAEDIIEHFQAMMVQFRVWQRELSALFAEQVLRGSDPWTPSVKAKLTRHLRAKLPDNPDWHALAEAVDTMLAKNKGKQS